MLKDIEVTLYDIFGYLLPGCVTLVALLIIVWTICYPGKAVPMRQPNTLICTVFLVLAYFAGHIVHAIADQLVKWFKQNHWQILDRTDCLPDGVKDATKQKIVNDLKLPPTDPKELDSEWLFSITDTIIGQCGNTADREIFVTRVGFYRGSLVALVVLWIALLFRVFVPISYVATTNRVIAIPGLVFSLAAMALIIGIMFLYHRYRKFIKYRVRNVIVSFLAMK